MPFEGGPYVQAACFCETVIQDVTGAMSLIRIIDTLNHQASGPNPPHDMPPVPHTMKLVLMFKPGQAQGRHDLTVRGRLPNGEAVDALNLSIRFEGDEKGANVLADFGFVFSFEGLYWFDVLLDDENRIQT